MRIADGGRWRLTSSGAGRLAARIRLENPLAPKKKSKHAWNNLERSAVQAGRGLHAADGSRKSWACVGKSVSARSMHCYHCLPR